MPSLKLQADARDRLRVYLNDHLAGAVGMLSLARRSQAANAGTALGDVLGGLRAEFAEDAAVLRRLLSDLGLAEARPKQGLAQAAERIGRLKLNGQLTGYSPLSRLVELDALSAGVDVKRSMWASLRQVRHRYPVVADVDLEALIERAERQRRTLEEHRLDAAASSFSP